MPVYSVRVRGIYSTALSAIYHKRGFLLAHASEVIKSRLGVPTVEAPPNVTVKSLEDSPDEVLIIGYPWEAGVEAERVLVEEVGYSAVRRARLGLYTVVDAVGKGGCRVELPGGLEGVVEDGCPGEGEAGRFRVVKEALDPEGSIVVKPGSSLVGQRVIASYPGSGVSFSRHLGSEARAEILSLLESRGVPEGVHLHFRSGAVLGGAGEAVREALELARRVVEVHGEPHSGEPRVVSRGEYASIVYLPGPSKRVLDEARRRVYPTVDYHHSLKASGPRESELVDYAEESMKMGACSEASGASILYFVAKRLEGSRIFIRHRLPDRRALRLGPFRVAGASMDRGSVVVVLERVFRGGGVLDGLGVEKKPGDRGRTIVSTGEWRVIHEYVSSDGGLLGVYANINTPPELGYSGVRYLDLYVDVVKRPGEPAEIVDMDELEKAYNEGAISEGLYRRAVEEAERTRRKLDSEYP